MHKLDKTAVYDDYFLNSQKTVQGKFGNLQHIRDNYPKHVLSLDPQVATTSYQGILHGDIREFCINLI